MIKDISVVLTFDLCEEAGSHLQSIETSTGEPVRCVRWTVCHFGSVEK